MKWCLYGGIGLRINAIINSNSILDTDGVIEPLDEKELIAKLSQLKADMSIDDVSSVLGKEPYYVKETGENIFVYYSGAITITLWGTNLFMVVVECNGLEIRIDLGNNINIPSV